MRKMRFQSILLAGFGLLTRVSGQLSEIRLPDAQFNLPMRQ